MLFYGLGISGISAAKSLNKAGFEVICLDDDEKSVIENKKKYPELNFC